MKCSRGKQGSGKNTAVQLLKLRWVASFTSLQLTLGAVYACIVATTAPPLFSPLHYVISDGLAPPMSAVQRVWQVGGAKRIHWIFHVHNEPILRSSNPISRSPCEWEYKTASITITLHRKPNTLQKQRMWVHSPVLTPSLRRVGSRFVACGNAVATERSRLWRAEGASVSTTDFNRFCTLRAAMLSANCRHRTQLRVRTRGQ